MEVAIMNNIFTNINQFAHHLLKNVIQQGDFVIDATAGNGFDTLFLAEQVGEKGKVFAFDIQKEAIANTGALLQEHNLQNQVQLINDGHENMGKYVARKVKGVMFNLGYLPKGEHSIITKGETTVEAVKQALTLLDINGVISIMVYTGHPGGKDEESALQELIFTLDKKKWDVLKLFYINRSEGAPYLIIIHRRGGDK